jgi:hypothetical protein
MVRVAARLLFVTIALAGCRERVGGDIVVLGDGVGD